MHRGALIEISIELLMASSSATDASLATMWASKLNAQETSMSYSSFRNLMRDLKRLGYDMPDERAFSGGHQAPERVRGHRCEFKDLLRLVWDPLAVWMTSDTSSGSSNIPEAQMTRPTHHPLNQPAKEPPPNKAVPTRSSSNHSMTSTPASPTPRPPQPTLTRPSARV